MMSHTPPGQPLNRSQRGISQAGDKTIPKNFFRLVIAVFAIDLELIRDSGGRNMSLPRSNFC
jgi:hypothetical protein